MKRRETIDDSVKEYAAEERRSRDGHPEVEQLAAYHRGQLPESAREEVQEHLAFCKECSRLVLDLEDFAELAPPGEEYRLSEKDVVSQKAALEERIRQEEEPKAKLLTFSRREEKARARRSIPWWYHGLAAALAAACLGLGYWVAAPRQTVSSARALSSLNPVVETLLPSTDGLRGGASPGGLTIPSESQLVLVLVLYEETSFPDYRVEIYGDEDRMLWSSNGLEPSNEGQLSLIFPNELPRDGSYRLELYGLRDDEREPLSEYSLSLVEGEARNSPNE